MRVYVPFLAICGSAVAWVVACMLPLVLLILLLFPVISHVVMPAALWSC
jgi:hypothetical protein